MEPDNKSNIYHYWGKAKNNEETSCHLLVYHCLDVAAVGDVLLNCDYELKNSFCNALGLPDKLFHSLVKFFLSVHDIGKFSEAFQGLRPDIYLKYSGNTAKLKYKCRHDTLGYAVWKNLWKQMKKQGFLGALTISKPLSKNFDLFIQVFAGHHGKPPEHEKYPEHFLNENDFQAVDCFVKEMATLFLPEQQQFQTSFEDKDFAAKFKPVSWCLAGLSVLCDWIGSDNSNFEYFDSEIPLNKYYADIALPTAEKAVRKSGILPAQKTPYSGINHLFEYIKTSTSTPLQSFCHESEISSEPQLWILEDVTGSGKTEAALTIAHRLMDYGQGNGLFIGLPTMATSNAMYERMAECYRKLFDKDAFPSLILAHSARHLSELFRQSLMSEHSGDLDYKQDEQSASAQCNAWLADHRKKALLADAGIGTIDQALLGILPVRHQSLRLFGLLGKILIIDEIHAFDEYTARLIETLLTFHAKMGGSAVLLSATLPNEMRCKFVQAFQNGHNEDFEIELKNEQYPLVAIVTGRKIDEYHVSTRKEVERKLEVQIIHDEKDVYKLILNSAKKGQCVCWIRNTVSDAMTAYLNLRDVHQIEQDCLMLFHSRYVLNDRLEIEKNILKSFGEKSGPELRKGKILIATQVVEQSLDLDFDVIVSDLAPVDLIIQRAGRLYRHVRDQAGKRKREKDSTDERPEPVFYVFGPDPVSESGVTWFKSYFQKGSFVYPHTGRLWRTANLLKNSGCIQMPDHARKLIEGVYNENKAEPYPEILDEASWKAEGESMGKGDMGRFNSLLLNEGYTHSNEKWGDDARFPTRIGEDTITVYLAQYQNGRLAPLVKGKYPWDMSSLRVYESKISNISPDTPTELKSKLDQLKADEKALNKYSLVLPMIQNNDDEWHGEGSDRKG